MKYSRGQILSTGDVIKPTWIFNNYCAHAHSCAIDDKDNSVLAVLTVFQILSMNKAQEKKPGK